MLLKDLIEQLQDIYSRYSQSYKQIEGEPEVAMELYERVKNTDYLKFRGITPELSAVKTPENIIVLKAKKQVKRKAVKPSTIKKIAKKAQQKPKEV